MTDKELITTTIDRYTDLQQIKKANGGHENEMLEYLIKVIKFGYKCWGHNPLIIKYVM